MRPVQGIRGAYRLLTAGTGAELSPPGTGFGGAWAGLLLLGALWGLAAVGLWHLAFEVFGKPSGLYLLMAVAVGGGMLLWPYRRAGAALAELLAGPEPGAQAVVASVLTAVLVGGLAVAGPDWHRQEIALPVWLAWVRPDSKIDRVLLLMPLWGAWSMLILPQFRRPDPQAAPALTELARQCGPVTATAVLAVLLAVSIGYFAYLPWVQLGISAAAMLAAVGGGLLLARRRGRVDRTVLLATNLLTQITFLLGFLAVRPLRFLW